MENNLPTQQPPLPTTQATQINEQQPVNKRSRKKWIILLPLVILLLAASSAYYLTYAKGKSCGGFTGETGTNACPEGYVCRYADNYPDASGSCLSRLEALFTKAEKKPVSTIPSSQSPTIAKIPTITPFVDLTANWKTYTNTTYGFTFKYPQDGTTLAKNSSSEITISNATESAPYYYFTLEVTDNLLNQTARDVLTNELISLKNNKSPGSVTLAEKRETTLKEYQIGQITGMYMRGGTDGDAVTDFIEIITVRNNKIYTFIIHDGNGSVGDFQKKLIDQILSTFYFTSISAETENLIKTALATYLKIDKIRIQVFRPHEVDPKYEGSYLAADYGLDGPGSGGVLFAKKSNGTWVVMHAGNGLPQCEDVEQFNAPYDFLSCVDANGKLKDK